MIKIQMRLVPSLPSVHVTNVPSVAYKHVPQVPCELHTNNCYINYVLFYDLPRLYIAVPRSGHKLE